MDPEQHIGPYRLLRIVGEGGMGSVHLAKREQMGVSKWVALKTIHPHLARQSSFVAGFLDEAKVAAALNHPNVTQLFEFNKTEDQFYLAMEYVHGETLAELIHTGPLAPEFAAKIISLAAEGLHHAHQLRDERGKVMGLVHRDVSPQNIFLSYEGHVKVTDFGIAWVKERRVATRTGHVKGKLAYMPLEQLHQDPIDRRVDVFALGVVLWELLAGYGPFRAKTEAQTMMRITLHDVKKPSTVEAGIPPELDAIVMRAIAADREDRFPTARALSRALEDFLMTHRLRVSSVELAGEMAARFPMRRAEKERWLRRPVSEIPAVQKALISKSPAEMNAVAERQQVETLDFVPEAVQLESGSSDLVEAVQSVQSVESIPPLPPAAEVPSRPNRRVLWGGLAGLLALGAAGFVFYPRHGPPESVPRSDPGTNPTTTGASEPELVVVTIGTSPAGATVTIDEVELGVTPYQTSSLLDGVHEIVLRLDGYETLLTSFDAAANDPNLWYELLVAEPELELPEEQESPVTPMRARPSTHRMGRTMSHRSRTEESMDSAMQAESAYLSLVANPWAAVKINGRAAGNTPLREHRVPSGRLTVQYRGQDQGPWQQIELTLAPGQRASRRLHF